MKDFDELNKELSNMIPELIPSGDATSNVFADIIFSHRLRSGLTQKKLAEKACVNASFIHKIEGGSAVNDETYKKVLNALNITWEEAFAFVNQKRSK